MAWLGNIYLTSNDKDQELFELLLVRLRAHFGDKTVMVLSGEPKRLTADDVVLVLLASSSIRWQENDTAPRWIEKALQLQSTLIPLVVDNAPLPAAGELPENVRGLLLQQWRNLERGYHFENDLGQLLLHIERRIPQRPDETLRWDLGLLVASRIMIVTGLIPLPFLIGEAYLWPYGLESLYELQLLRNAELTTAIIYTVGCILGAFSSWRSAVLTDIQKTTNARRLGSTYNAPRRSLLEYLTVGCAWSALRIGAWSVAGVVVMGIVAVLTQFMKTRRISWQPWMLTSCVGVAMGSTITISLDRRLDRIELAVQEVEVAMDRFETLSNANDFAFCEAAFLRAREKASFLPQPYHGLALLYFWRATQRMPDSVGGGFLSFFPSEPFSNFEPIATSVRRDPARTEALRQAEFWTIEALNRYPDRARGLFLPSTASAGLAYAMYADILYLNGELDIAREIKQKANDVSPWLDIFGGLFRWWEYE